MADSPSTVDKAVAAELFNEGRTLLDQGRIGPACRKLEESQRLDPGGGTLLNVAVCHGREGRTATAWLEFTEALGIAKRDDRPQRVEFARAHLAQLEQELSRLVIQVPSSADVPDLEVKRDGTIVGRAAWGSAVPVDPGDHVIEASAPGKTIWKQSVTVGPKADAKTVVVPALDDAASTAAPPVEGTAPGSGAPAATRPKDLGAAPIGGAASPSPDAATGGEATSKPSSAGAVVGWTAIGVGVVGLGLGTYFGLHALSLKNSADHNCLNDVCSPDGESQNSDAIRSAGFATAGFAVGAAGVAVGTIVLLATRSDAHPHAGEAALAPPKVAVGGTPFPGGGGGLTVRGSW